MCTRESADLQVPTSKLPHAQTPPRPLPAVTLLILVCTSLRVRATSTLKICGSGLPTTTSTAPPSPRSLSTLDLACSTKAKLVPLGSTVPLSSPSAWYQYQFANTENVFMGFIQTKTPYYQPTPDARSSPYPLMASWKDPNYNTICTLGGKCDVLALRILNSHGLYVYGAGLYSFFNDYSTACLAGTNCRSQIFDIENSSGIYVYALSTVGTTCMIFRDGKCIANAAVNVNVFPDTIAMYQSG